MRKGIKIFFFFLSTIILLIIMVPVVVSILLSSHTIQNYVAGRFMDSASKRLETTVSLDRINIRLFNRLVVDGFYVEDHQGDTLLYVDRLEAGFRGYGLRTGTIRLGDVKLDKACFYVSEDSTETTNLKYVTDKLKRENPPEETKDLIVRAQSLTLDSVRFRLRKYEVPERPYGINFKDLEFRDLRMELENIHIFNDSVRTNIRKIAFREKSGFNCLQLSAGQAVAGETGISLEEFYLKDPYSELRMREFSLRYDRWSAFKNFTDEVTVSGNPENSRVAFRTVGYFAPNLRDWRSVARFNGEFKGTVADFSGHFDEMVIGDTKLNTRFSISGLPEIEETRFVLDVQELTTHAHSAADILYDFTGKELGNALHTLERLEDVRISGKFDGLLTDFHADGQLVSAPGDIDFNVRLNPEESGRTHIDGNVSLENFELGHLLSVPDLGHSTLTAELDGFIQSDSLRLIVDALIDRVYFNGYDYRNIDLDGEIRNNYYKGLVASSDPNADFLMEGTFDFNRDIPEYDFTLDLRHLDLCKTRINRRDSVSLLSAHARIKAQGTTLDDITGNGMITDLFYAYPGDTLRTHEISLFGDNLSQQKRLVLNSDFLDVELTSRLNMIDIVPYARQTIRYYLPSLDSIGTAPSPHLQAQLDRTAHNSTTNYYVLKAQVKKNGKFASAILPGLYLSPETNLSFLFNPAIRDFSLALNSELIEYKNIYISDLNLTNRNQADSIALYIRTEEAGIKNFFMPGLTVHGGIRNNLVNLSTGFSNPLNGMSAMINTVSRLQADQETKTTEWHTRFTTSRIRIHDQEWRITSPGIVWGNGTVDVNRFRILTQGQNFLLHGRVSPEPSDTLHLSMTNFDLSPLSSLIGRFGYGVTGRTNGHADLIAGKGDALFYGRIGFDDVKFNDKPVKNSTFTSEWDPADNRIRMSLVLNESRDTVIHGGYRPGDKRYFINARLPNIDLALLSPVLDGVLTDIEGTAHADVVLRGTGGTPSLDGTISIPYFAGTVDFTQVRYHIDDAVARVENNNLFLSKTPVYDDEGGQGEAELALRTKYFSQMSYDVQVRPQRMLALNTTVQDNDYFYGKAYASGSVSIHGDRRGVNMDMNVTTENNSTFFMPLTGASSIAEADFIVFENPHKSVEEEPSSRYRLIRQLREKKRNNNAGQGDLDIKMTVNVRPNTEVQLVIDPKIGDIIKANGTGALKLHVRPKEDLFTMYGDYHINEGSYLFTLMNILNKRFTIEQGSSIQWVGDPLEAILNVSAAYRVRTSVGQLVPGYNMTVPVDCKILLSDRLSQPTINFDIDLPNADAELRNAVQNLMNTQELKSQQFVWLLMSNSFYVDTGTGSMNNIGTTTTAVTGIEFLTNQFSNWLSTERFNFNLGYTPKSDLGSNEVEGMFSGELIRNKLFFEGEINYNFADNEADPRKDNQVSGDFYLTYVIDRTGNLRTKVFSRTIDRYDENQGLQEQGLGLYYKRDFDRWRELFRRRDYQYYTRQRAREAARQEAEKNKQKEE